MTKQMNQYKKLRNKLVLVTGGAGFIGSEVVLQLSKNGASVIVFDNYSSGKRKYVDGIKNVKLVKGSLTNRAQVNKIVKKVDYIINMAALPFIPDSFYYPNEFFKVNTEGTINLVTSIFKSKKLKMFLHISTSEVYGTAKFTPMTEDHPTLPQSTYAASKLAGERAVFTLHKEHGFPAIIIRPFNSYGPRITQPYIIPEIINQIIQNRKKITLGNVDASRDFTYVSDTANGIISGLVSENAIGETINIASKKTYKIRYLVNTIAKIMDTNVKIVIDKDRMRPFDVQKLLGDNSKAKKLLGWQPTLSIEEGLSRTIDWVKQNPLELTTPFKGWSKTYRMNNKS